VIEQPPADPAPATPAVVGRPQVDRAPARAPPRVAPLPGEREEADDD
jgi:hypothetical protein